MSQNFGWLPPEERTAEQQAFHEKLVGMLPRFQIVGEVADKPTSAYLWQATLKVLGKHAPHYPQQIGDCVSFGTKNVLETLQSVEIALRGDREEWHPIFPPYIYGISRIQIGGGRIGGDGSVGSWAADGCKRFGVLRADESGVPQYSGSIARQWGSQGPPKELIEKAKPHLIKSTAQVSTFQQVADAILNGYPVTVASNYGFEGRPFDKNGKRWLRRAGSWAHQMCFIGVDLDPAAPGAYCLNSHPLSMAPTPLNDEPHGGWWVPAEDVEGMVRQDDSFAYSQFDGFPAQALVYDIL